MDKKEKPILTYRQLIDLAFQHGRYFGARECMECSEYRELQTKLLQEIDDEFCRTQDAYLNRTGMVLDGKYRL